MLPWNTVDDIYLPLNLENEHWVLCVVHLQEWRIDVYDCDQTVCPGVNFDPFIQPLCEMFPYFLVGAMFSEGEKARYPKLSLSKFEFSRLPHPTVPKATTSGDCGFFVIMYLEFLTAKLLDVKDVNSSNMVFWRKKWAVRLFHNILNC